MPRTCSLIICSLNVLCICVSASAENPSLAQRYPLQRLGEILTPQLDWQPFPTATQTDAWQQLPADVRMMLIDLGTESAAADVPSLPATLYLEFRRVGNRSRYQDRWFERRRLLNNLALAECVEGQGRFLDPLANVIWAICEESSWTLPAHIGVQKTGSGLPDNSEPIVALFSAETASSLAWVVYLLEDQLDGVSPLICRRIRREIDERILTPYLERDDFSWMGFGRRGRPNNWNPWINSNVLAATLLLEENPERRLQTVHKVLRSLDNFFVPHPEDGSCDEGPSYWTRAGASLFDNLELLYSATGGKLDVYDDEAVKNIGRFIYRTHITGNAYVCVGDCDAQIDIPRNLVFRYGQRIGDSNLQRLATFDMTGNPLSRSSRGFWSMMRPLFALFTLKEMRAASKSTAPLPRDVWLGDEDMQLMVARDRKGTSAGLFLAGWGGHNAQSHNHNDVGNYIVFVDGSPMLIDVGRPTYTRQTFSGDRYKIWAMQSAYHNLPTVNGRAQGVGRRYAAAVTSYRADENMAELELDITAAFPKEAGIATWMRTMRLVRGESIVISDSFRLDEPSSDIVQHLMTTCDVSVKKPGEFTLTRPDTQVEVVVNYEPAGWEVQVETVPLTDQKLSEMWGPLVRRINVKCDEATSGDVCKLKITAVK